MKQRRVSAGELRDWFDTYNVLYFYDRLPHNAILYFVEMKNSADCETHKTEIDGQTWIEIRINKGLQYFPNEARVAVLHEMNHAWGDLTDHRINHGPRFDKGIARLWRMGAYKGLL